MADEFFTGINEELFQWCQGRHSENLHSLSLSQSIDPGQQFTWEHSNLEVNKPKNRYANVIAYDHSRVLLSAIDGMPSANITTQCCTDSTNCSGQSLLSVGGIFL